MLRARFSAPGPTQLYIVYLVFSISSRIESPFHVVRLFSVTKVHYISLDFSVVRASQNVFVRTSKLLSRNSVLEVYII